MCFHAEENSHFWPIFVHKIFILISFKLFLKIIRLINEINVLNFIWLRICFLSKKIFTWVQLYAKMKLIKTFILQIVFLVKTRVVLGFIANISKSLPTNSGKYLSLVARINKLFLNFLYHFTNQTRIRYFSTKWIEEREREVQNEKYDKLAEGEKTKQILTLNNNMKNIQQHKYWL